jgi:cytidylate kinase
VASERVRLVTVSAVYGAGGSVVAPALARRLGVPFLQRATTTSGDLSGAHPAAAERLHPEEESSTPVHPILAAFTHAMPAGPTQSPPPTRQLDDDLRGESEAGIRDLAATGSGVILGRGAAVVLGKDTGFHVRLEGHPDRRAAQGAQIEAVSEEEARRHLKAADGARTAYVRRLYRADPADPRHYHLVIDSTVIPLETVTEMILLALNSLPDR